MNFIKEILAKKYFPLTIFAIAMGILEAIVVVYVREIYYPEGFAFPLKQLPERLILIEIVREICTLIMLGSVAWITGKIFLQRLSVFLFLFGIWDMFYYVGLKLFIDWPESLLTWDILFLIPITWIGPVLAPVICSVVMILMALIFEWSIYQNRNIRLKTGELLFILFGAGVIFYTFIYDFGKIILQGEFLKKLNTLTNDPKFNSILTSFIPENYKWEHFSIGMLIIILAISFYIKRHLKQ